MYKLTTSCAEQTIIFNNGQIYIDYSDCGNEVDAATHHMDKMGLDEDCFEQVLSCIETYDTDEVLSQALDGEKWPLVMGLVTWEDLYI